MLITFNAGAGSQTRYEELGDFFRLLDSAAPIDVFFYQNGREVSKAEGIGEGYSETFAQAFDAIVIKSASAQSVQFVSRFGNRVSYDAPPTGAVTVQNLPALQGGFNQNTVTVGTVSTAIRAANAARRYLLIQNNDAANAIRVHVAGGAPTLAAGIKIAPGGSIEFAGNYVPTGAVNGICSAANPNVDVIEG